jgi:hypothetical protein
MNIRVTLVLAGALLPTLVQSQSALEPLARATASSDTATARYPRWSRPLEAGAADPVLQARTPQRYSALGADGAGPQLTVWASTVAAQPGETVTLFAKLTPVAAPGLFAAPALTGARISAELVAEQLGVLGTVAYRDNGTGPDALARDGIYTASVTLPAGPALALGTADPVTLEVTARLPDDTVRQATGSFQFTRPAVRLTGRYADSVRNGNLIIAAEVEARATGPVQLSGTLADGSGPFVTAQSAQLLTPGRHWMELSFYGLAFHDRGVTGVVQLASVALASMGTTPLGLGPLALAAHTTQHYPLAQFTARLFDDPVVLDSARRLRLDTTPIAMQPRQERPMGAAD